MTYNKLMEKNAFTLAVQPRSWEAFDVNGADYVTDMEMAELVAYGWGEPCTIWRCPANGAPFRLRWV